MYEPCFRTHVKLPLVKLPPLAITSTVTTGGAAPASEPAITVALPTPVAQEGPAEEPATPASEPAAAPTPGTTLVQITEETDERRRLSVFSASARRKRAAGHLRQVEKRRHDPHPGVTGQLEYDHPVSYEVAVAKKPAEPEPEQLAAEAAASPAAARRLRGGRA